MPSTGRGPISSHKRLAHVVRPEYVGLYRFHRVVFAARNVLQGRRMVYDVHALRGLGYAVEVPHVAYHVLEPLLPFELVLHVVLLLFVARKDDYLGRLLPHFEQAAHYLVAEAARAARDEDVLVRNRLREIHKNHFQNPPRLPGTGL